VKHSILISNIFSSRDQLLVPCFKGNREYRTEKCWFFHLIMEETGYQGMRDAERNGAKGSRKETRIVVLYIFCCIIDFSPNNFFR
jgi:hypothetical protein